MIKKTICLTLALMTLLLFTSCAQTPIESTESIVSAVSEVTSPLIVTEITGPQEDGYDLWDVGMLDDNSIIALLVNKENTIQKRIYRMNLSDNTSKLIYDGEAEGSYFLIKNHPNGTYSIQFENNNAFIFDSATDQLFKTVDFEKVEGAFFSISNSGKQVVYESREGLCVSDLDMNNETVVYKSGEMSPYWPVFSNDDSKIAFPMAESIGEATPMKKCVIYDVETKESVMFDCSASELFWPVGSEELIAWDNGSFIEFAEEGSHIWCFDLAGHEINHLNVEGQITPMGVVKQGALYFHNPRPSKESSVYRDYKIMLWNYDNGDLRELDLGYQFAWIGACRVSQNGDKILFTASVVIDEEVVKKVLLVNFG